MNTPNFSDIYTLYFEDVYKYLLALCHDEELAEELAQDTFFKAMKSYENFRGDCKITTWLCQIAKHSFFLYEKHRKRNIDLNSVENEIVDTNSIEILLGQREQAFGICSNHHRGSYTSPALAAASYPFVDLPPGNTLRCKLFPSSKFTIHLFPKANGHGIIEPRTI